MAERRGVIARLATLGVSPNAVSWLGLVLTLFAAACLVAGAGHALPFERDSAPVPTSWWPLLACFWLALAAAADLLDGAIARAGNRATPSGAMLDSTLDRFGDMAIYIACALYFAADSNRSYVLVSCLALVGTVQISYVKARGENLTGGLGVGFYQRGERFATLLMGAFLGRIPAALCILAIFQFFTVWRRVRLAMRRLDGEAEPPPPRFAPWRRRRWSGPFLFVGVCITLAMLLSPWAHPFFWGAADPLGGWLDRH